MTRKLAGLTFSITLLVTSAAAQTVTGSGTTNTVPVFTGSSAVGNSPITVSNGNVGIGTTTPTPGYLLDVNGPITLSSPNTQITGNTSLTLYGDQYAWFGMTILKSGNVGIDTLNPGFPLEVAGSVTGGAPFNALYVNNLAPYGGGNGSGPARINLGRGLNNPEGYIEAGSGDDSDSSYGYLAFGNRQANTITEAMRVAPTGNVGIGTTSPGVNYKLDVAGQIHTSTGVTYPDGTQQTTAWTGVLCGGDYAESVDVIGGRSAYAPGDVLVIDPKVQGKFLKSAEPYSTAVTGIYSTRPGIIGRRQSGSESSDEIPMAMTGIVPTKVSAENGAIHPGDLLVTSSTSGLAMKGTDRSRMFGAVIGKALGSLESGNGVIEVVVMLQ